MAKNQKTYIIFKIILLCIIDNIKIQLIPLSHSLSTCIHTYIYMYKTDGIATIINMLAQCLLSKNNESDVSYDVHTIKL